MTERQENGGAHAEACSFLRDQKQVPPINDIAMGLTLSCRDHLQNQGTKGTLSHTGSDGSSELSRMNRYGLASAVNGENLSCGYAVAEDILVQMIVNDGVDSRADRKNIFNRDFRYIGIAIGDHSIH